MSGTSTPDGYLFITGRIKEQYKLENGKYVMPAPLEEQLALSPYITQVMLYGQDRPYNVALVAVDAAKIRAWAMEQGVPMNGELALIPAVHDLIANELGRLSTGFRSYERPRAFVLTAEELTTENGMLTPTMKVKRRDVLKRYGDALDALYEPAPAIPPSLGPELRQSSPHITRPDETSCLHECHALGRTLRRSASTPARGPRTCEGLWLARTYAA